MTADVTGVRRLTGSLVDGMPGTGGSFVVSGAGLWPLLAALAAGACEPARAELAAATGIDPADGLAACSRFLHGLTGIDGVAAALGLWVREEVAVRPDWSGGLPAATVERLTGDPARDQPVLDAWADRHTDGLVPVMPVAVDAGTLLVLASALTATAQWRHPFTEDDRHLLQRSVSATHSAVDVVDGVTRAVVTGRGDVDVDLLLGAPGADPRAVLRTGLQACGDRPQGAAADLDRAHGVTVGIIEHTDPADLVRLRLPAFTVESRIDLLATDLVDRLGLRTASDATDSRFPLLADAPPLAVGQAVQHAVAEFGAVGFRAAAVTAIAMVRAGFAPRTDRFSVRSIDVRLDRPFGFVAVHRPTGLPLFAGWVAG